MAETDGAGTRAAAGTLARRRWKKLNTTLKWLQRAARRCWNEALMGGHSGPVVALLGGSPCRRRKRRRRLPLPAAAATAAAAIHASPPMRTRTRTTRTHRHQSHTT